MLNSKQLNRLVYGEVNNVKQAVNVMPTTIWPVINDEMPTWKAIIAKSVDSKSKKLLPCSP